MMDLLNPDLKSLRAYFNDPSMLPGIDQDWEIIITSDETAEYLLVLSTEGTPRHKELVELLYLYTESVLRNWGGSSREALQGLLSRVSYSAPEDVRQWKSKPEHALTDPIILEREPHDFDDYFFAEYFGHGRIF